MNEIKAYFTAPKTSSPAWIDKDRLAAISNRDGIAQIYEINVNTGEMRQRTFGKERVSEQSPNPATGDILFTRDSGGNENMQLFVLREDGSEIAFRPDPAVRNHIGSLSADGKKLYFTCNARNKLFSDYCEGNLADGSVRMILQSDSYSNEPMGTSPDGRYFLFGKPYIKLDSPLFLYDTLTGSTKRVPEEDGIMSDELWPCWKSDSSGFYLLSDHGIDKMTPAYYDIASESMQFLLPEGAYNADGLALSADDRYLAVVWNEGGFSKLTVYDLEDHMTALNLPSAPKGVMNSLTWSPEGLRLAFSFQSGSYVPDLWMLDIAADRLRRLTDGRETAGLEGLVEPELRSFSSFDGVTIPYLLYVPRGKEAKDLPVMVQIHGGPSGQARPEYVDYIQYVLSLGIAVVSPNVRGSGGYGRAYLLMDDVEKRLDTVKDIEALVKHLTESGIADAGKLAVYGASYGGYMCLNCLGRMPDVWKCGVDLVGMFNLVTFLERTSAYRRANREREYGTLEHDRELLYAVSPAAVADKIKAPLFVEHGANDPRVPSTEADQVVAKLRAQGVSVEFMRFENEGHGITRTENRLACYPRAMQFVKEHLLGDEA